MPQHRQPAGEIFTFEEVCDLLRVSLSTFYKWHNSGRAPRCIRLPNGDLRIRENDLQAWLDANEEEDR